LVVEKLLAQRYRLVPNVSFKKKRLQKDEYETVAQIEQLTTEIGSLQTEANELTARIEAIKRKEGNEREVLKRKHAEEVQFLKRNNQQLKQQLEGIVQSKK